MRKEESVDHQIKTAWHAIARAYNQQAAQYEMTTSIGYVLLNIDREGTPATKIAPLMGLESRSLTRILKTMEEKGLVYKQQDQHDRRSVRIFLTEEGKKKRNLSRKTVMRFNETVKQTVEAEKLETFFEVIGEIQRLIDENKVYNTVES